jgi:hypothetical protein
VIGLSTTRSTSVSVSERWRMRSAIVPSLRSCCAANCVSSGMRAIEPSAFMISQMTAAGVSPASSARSHPASCGPRERGRRPSAP